MPKKRESQKCWRYLGREWKVITAIRSIRKEGAFLGGCGVEVVLPLKRKRKCVGLEGERGRWIECDSFSRAFLWPKLLCINRLMVYQPVIRVGVCVSASRTENLLKYALQTTKTSETGGPERWAVNNQMRATFNDSIQRAPIKTKWSTCHASSLVYVQTYVSTQAKKISRSYYSLKY